MLTPGLLRLNVLAVEVAILGVGVDSILKIRN